jgi:hypothetical protein
MSLPTEFDFAVIKLGDGDDPEVFAVSCGKNDITTTFGANTTDRFVRDCAKPGEVPFRKTKATGKQLDAQATGLTDATAFGTEVALVGKLVNTKIEYYTDDGTDAGDLIGTIACAMRVTSLEIGAPREGESSSALSLASHGAWTWTAA